jgi:hypothetical protein
VQRAVGGGESIHLLSTQGGPQRLISQKPSATGQQSCQHLQQKLKNLFKVGRRKFGLACHLLNCCLKSCEYLTSKKSKGIYNRSDDGCCLAITAGMYTVLATQLLFSPTRPPWVTMFLLCIGIMWFCYPWEIARQWALHPTFFLLVELIMSIVKLDKKNLFVQEQQLAINWGIGVKDAANTLKATTQSFIRSPLHPVERQFKTKNVAL